jgi:SRSO17 transposase
MSLVRKYVAAGLDDAARRSRRWRMTVGALDETGQEKQGSSTAGVKRQYMGCAGRVANGINTVYLSYVREKTGHALAGARQWVPAEDIKDPVKSLLTGLPLDLRFRTKGQLAIDVLADACADGLAFDFICGDEVYGSCTELRQGLERRGQAYVLPGRVLLHGHARRRHQDELRGRREDAGERYHRPLERALLQKQAIPCRTPPAWDRRTRRRQSSSATLSTGEQILVLRTASVPRRMFA